MPPPGAGPALPTPATKGARAFLSVAGSLALHAALLAVALVWARSQANPVAADPVEVEIVIERAPETPAPPPSPITPPQESPQSVAETSPEPARVRDTTPTPEPTPTPTSEPSPLAPQPTPAPRPESTPTPTPEPTPTPTLEPTPLLEPTPAPRPPTTPLRAPEAKRVPPPIARPKSVAAPKATASRVAALEPAKPANPAAAVRAAAGEYQSAVLARINAYKRYPDIALERGARGMAIVSFTLDGGGRVVSAALVKSSGDSALDADAVETVRRAAPFAPPPAGAPRTFSAPLNYVPR